MITVKSVATVLVDLEIYKTYLVDKYPINEIKKNKIFFLAIFISEKTTFLRE